jgi:hypothetical protein
MGSGLQTVAGKLQFAESPLLSPRKKAQRERPFHFFSTGFFPPFGPPIARGAGNEELPELVTVTLLLVSPSRAQHDPSLLVLRSWAVILRLAERSNVFARK